MLGSAHNLKNQHTRTKQALRLAFDIAEKEKFEKPRESISDDENYVDASDSHAHFVTVTSVKIIFSLKVASIILAFFYIIMHLYAIFNDNWLNVALPKNEMHNNMNVYEYNKSIFWDCYRTPTISNGKEEDVLLCDFLLFKSLEELDNTEYDITVLVMAKAASVLGLMSIPLCILPTTFLILEITNKKKFTRSASFITSILCLCVLSILLLYGKILDYTAANFRESKLNSGEKFSMLPHNLAIGALFLMVVSSLLIYLVTYVQSNQHLLPDIFTLFVEDS